MGFLSGGPSLSVFGETWKPQLEWTGILLNEGRLEAFTQHGLIGCGRRAAKVVCGDVGVC